MFLASPAATTRLNSSVAAAGATVRGTLRTAVHRTGSRQANPEPICAVRVLVLDILPRRLPRRRRAHGEFAAQRRPLHTRQALQAAPAWRHPEAQPCWPGCQAAAPTRLLVGEWWHPLSAKWSRKGWGRA